MTQRQGNKEGQRELATLQTSNATPTEQRGATGETEELYGDPWNAGDRGPIFSKGYSFAKIKFKGEARKYSHRKDIVKL